MEAKGNKMRTSCYIWELLKYKPWLYLAVIMLWIIKDTIPLIYGVLVKEFFDILAGKPKLNIGIIGLLFLIIMLTVIQISILHLGFKSSGKHELYISTLLRRNMLNSILKKAGAKAIPTSVGEAINSFRDDVEILQASVGWLSWLTGQITRAVAAIVILMTINLKMTILVFMPLAAIIVLAQRSEKRVEKNREQSRKAAASVTGAIGEIFESVLAIKVSGSKKSIISNLKGLNKKRHRLMVKDSLLSQLIDSIYNNAVNLGTGLVLLLAAYSIKSGSFGVGDFALFVYYLGFVTDSIESTGNFLVHFQQTGVSIKRIIGLTGSKTDDEIVKHKAIYFKEKDAFKHQKTNEVEINIKDRELKTLEVKGLSYYYEGFDKGIKDMSFTLNKGEVTVICGRTGCGKSTLLKALIGLLPADSGKIYWNGNIIENPQTFFVPPVSAYTSQIPNLFSETVKNNILLGISEKTADLEGAINSAVLERDIDKLEVGLDTVIGPKGVKLSGGQLQRVAAARMFIRKAQLLVFDDISSALDVETEKILWSRLFNDNKPTCIIVSNRKQVIEQADNIILMKDGTIEARGKLPEILKTSKEIQLFI